jgi:single-stranded-DNA-specific exonuclease
MFVINSKSVESIIVNHKNQANHSTPTMKTARWHLMPTDNALAQRLETTLGLEPLIANLLAQRGIDSPEAARQFFCPEFADLHNPFLMQDMYAAVARLDAALQNGEHILLYGDYDVDGTTSVALMYAFLSRLSAKLDYYLPDREKEGYGVSLAGVEYARENACSLIIAMDCGIKANAAVSLAKSYGIDFIICDHHLPEGALPEAVANLDPKRADCPYPFKELSGCGIAFKLAQALSLQYNTPSEELASLLDLLAISIACDIVPMIGENRTLVHFGLRCVNRSPRIGLSALIDSMNRPKPLTVMDLVFGLGPMINAAGRLGDARDAVKLLLSADKASALEAAGHLLRRNADRRTVDYATADEARLRFRSLPGWEQKKSIVLFDPAWHKGVIGISASRIAEDFYKPTVILTESNGRAVGSARSVRGFDLYAALQHCEDLFFSYGGHAHAAGMQMPVENVPAFTERFETVVGNNIILEQENPTIEIAAKIDFKQITTTFWSKLKQFEPFGPSNMSPVFWAENVVDTGHSKVLDNNHVRLSLRQETDKPIFTGIGFGLGKAFEAVKNGHFDIAFSLKEENWKGHRKLALYVKDLRRK